MDWDKLAENYRKSSRGIQEAKARMRRILDDAKAAEKAAQLQHRDSGRLLFAAGRITTVLAMPNTEPPIDNPSLVAFVKAKARAEACVNVLVSGADSSCHVHRQALDDGGLGRGPARDHDS